MTNRGLFFLLLLLLCITRVVKSDGACRKEAATVVLIGQYVPRCDEKTGNYKVRQCSGSVGRCWCVDEHTGESVGDALTMDENDLPNCEPNCFKTLQNLPSILIHDEPVIVGEYIPNCDPHTGYFQPKQCLRNNKECWCVSKLGKELKSTRTTDLDNFEC